MRPAVFCYAPRDAALAREVGAYLEANLPIEPLYEEGGVVRADRDLIDSVGSAISAEIAIAILSPDSVPERWERSRWEPVFLQQPAELGSQLYFVLARACKFPELLRRQAFFDCSESLLGGLRAMKRHVFVPRRWVELPKDGSGSTSDLEPLRAALADRPGSASDLPTNTALAFGHRFYEDFEGTLWVDCAYRSAAGILGDIARGLGLTLTGSVDQNASALGRFCEERRCLFLYENLEPSQTELVDFKGRSSLITVAAGERRPLLSIDATLAFFSRWTQDTNACLRHLGDAFTHLRTAGPRLGMPMLAVLKHFSRLAEANEVLELLIAGAREDGDSDALRRFLWDQSWILGHWGEPYDAAALPDGVEREGRQLGFQFA